LHFISIFPELNLTKLTGSEDEPLRPSYILSSGFSDSVFIFHLVLQFTCAVLAGAGVLAIVVMHP
jgi:hypothetical protein